MTAPGGARGYERPIFQSPSVVDVKGCKLADDPLLAECFVVHHANERFDALGPPQAAAVALKVRVLGHVGASDAVAVAAAEFTCAQADGVGADLRVNDKTSATHLHGCDSLCNRLAKLKESSPKMKDRFVPATDDLNK